MSSYFVNSFCGRYPNGADFQLHNYGDHSSGNEQYRDSTTMHSSRYGYGYNGMDLTVGREGTGHFVGNERTRGYSPSHSAATTPSVEPVRYTQSANNTGTASLSPAPPDPLPCSSVASSSPVTETQSQHRAVKNSLTTQCSTPCSSSNGGTLLLSRDCVSKASPLEEEKPAGSAPTTPQNVSDSTQPQIYPWMRKLHINHGKVGLFQWSCIDLRDLSCVDVWWRCDHVYMLFRDFMTLRKTAPNWIVWLFEKHKIYLLPRGAWGAICASHLFGVLLLFSRVNTEQVRADLITWHTKFRSDVMYWTYKQNMCVFCLLFCILWSKIHNSASFYCINSSPQGAVEKVCAWLCYMLFFKIVCCN